MMICHDADIEKDVDAAVTPFILPTQRECAMRAAYDATREKARQRCYTLLPLRRFATCC